ncbi:hypothetical protein LEP1GSC127_4365 [Leptospira kirschneri str. 200801925]|nr:hypothetical protein LEP1GSC127_4365 [Leptospira kirschneri str. 200801925]
MTLKDSKPELIKLYSSLGKIITSSLEQQEVLRAGLKTGCTFES